jgi:hypothetical protein
LCNAATRRICWTRAARKSQNDFFKKNFCPRRLQINRIATGNDASEICNFPFRAGLLPRSTINRPNDDIIAIYQ